MLGFWMRRLLWGRRAPSFAARPMWGRRWRMRRTERRVIRVLGVLAVVWLVREVVRMLRGDGQHGARPA